MRRYLLTIIIVVIIVAIVGLNLTKPPGKKVQVIEVKKERIAQTVDGSGSLRAKTQVDISSQVIGQVKRIYVEEGDVVRRGDILIKLDDVAYRAEYEKARVQLDDARRNYERARRLHDDRLIADEELEKAKLKLDLARARYAQANDELKKTEIRAPISGRVLAVNVETGETVLVGTMNNPGTVLLTLADLNRMIAEIEVGETEVPKVRVGQKALVRIEAIPDTLFPGEVVKVGYMPIQTMTTLERTTDFEVEIEMENPGPLRPGMSAEAEIKTEVKDRVLVIPIQALSRKREGMKTVSKVFVYEDGRAKSRTVRTGLASDQKIEIIDGLKEGDSVIIGPYRILSRLKDGEKVLKEEERSPLRLPRKVRH
ncbi:MAG TPA: efflux RND transporter periplasmic adaptor subunit [bacterium (Candidatus Stahlbacteria)]|nr:efflux RND transporter periplasmic adaptor subunit [Candidatus Stahlbacteria bacterium]